MGKPYADTNPFPGSNGQWPMKKEPRAHKPSKRPALLGASRGDSTTSRVKVSSSAPSDADSKAREKEIMAASFLQYCAMCEKQITTPCNSLLYCSEACRRKDSKKPLSAAALLASPPRSTPVPSPARPTMHARAASSATATYQEMAPLLRIPPDMHNHKSDLDPTEWKPKLGANHRKSSEAFRYLSRFHQTMMAANGNDAAANPASDTPMDTHDDAMTVQYQSPSTVPLTSKPALLAYRSATSTTALSTPSLSMTNTPTTASSSFDSGSAMSHAYQRDYDYDFNLRPLPPRQNPLYYSTSAGCGRGIDLVTPHVAPSIADDLAHSVPSYDHDFWGKKKVVSTGNRGETSRAAQEEGLGALFAKAT